MLFLECTWFIAWIEPNTANNNPNSKAIIYISGFPGGCVYRCTVCRQCSLCKMIIFYANDEIQALIYIKINKFTHNFQKPDED